MWDKVLTSVGSVTYEQPHGSVQPPYTQQPSLLQHLSVKILIVSLLCVQMSTTYAALYPLRGALYIGRHSLLWRHLLRDAGKFVGISVSFLLFHYTL